MRQEQEFLDRLPDIIELIPDIDIYGEDLGEFRMVMHTLQSVLQVIDEVSRTKVWPYSLVDWNLTERSFWEQAGKYINDGQGAIKIFDVNNRNVMSVAFVPVADMVGVAIVGKERCRRGTSDGVVEAVAEVLGSEKYGYEVSLGIEAIHNGQREVTVGRFEVMR